MGMMLVLSIGVYLLNKSLVIFIEGLQLYYSVYLEKCVSHMYTV